MITRTKFGSTYQTGVIRFLLAPGVPFNSSAEAVQLASMRGWEQSRLRLRHHLRASITAMAENVYRRLLRFQKRHQPLDSAQEIRRPFDSSLFELFTVVGRCDTADRDLLENQMAEFTTIEVVWDVGLNESHLRLLPRRAPNAATKRAEGRNATQGNYCPALFYGKK